MKYQETLQPMRESKAFRRNSWPKRQRIRIFKKGKKDLICVFQDNPAKWLVYNPTVEDFNAEDWVKVDYTVT